MTAPSFVVPVADLERGPRRVTWAISPAWLRAALAGTDAAPRGADGELSVELTKTAGEVMVRGRASAALTMPCVRTLDPVDVDVRTDLFLLLNPAPPEPRPRARKRKPGASDATPSPKPKRAEAPSRRGRPTRDEAEEIALTESDAARDAYSGDEVVLDPFLREFILLELPMRPLRSDLRLEQETASTRPSAAPEAGRSALVSAEAPRAIDPRLAPLAALKSRLGLDKE